jgi:hypothetical protein
VAVAYEGEGMDGILDPVLHITPEFHELSKTSLEVLPLELGSSEALATLPPQSHTTLASEDLIMKVENSLKKVIIRGKRRKRGVGRKALAAA